MKKIVFLLIFILLPGAVSNEETHSLKLKASRHPEFLRIVLEGGESIISKGIVNQKGKNILVRFPDTHFTIQEEKVAVTYNKTDKDTLLFSPEDFHKFKVSSLKNPSRLVIDVYLKAEEKDTRAPSEVSDKSQIRKIKTVIIDPGHGGYESGIIAKDYKEKNVVLDIAKRLKALINRDSTTCLLTRESDQFMPLEERVKFVNTKDAEVFLSLHIGRHSDIVLYTPVITESAPSYIRTFLVDKGQEGFMSKTAALSNAIQKAIIEDFGKDMVSTKPLPYSILSKIEAGALIIELPSFEDAYYVSEFETKIVNTIYRGLLSI